MRFLTGLLTFNIKLVRGLLCFYRINGLHRIDERSDSALRRSHRVDRHHQMSESSLGQTESARCREPWCELSASGSC
jgi:hypothetical protein